MCVELTPFASSLEDGVTSRDPIVLRPGFLFLFRKKKRVPRTATLSLRQSCLNISEGLFLAEFAQAGGRWVTYSNLPHKHTRGCVLPSAQTMTAAPVRAVALSGGCRSSRSPPRRAQRCRKAHAVRPVIIGGDSPFADPRPWSPVRKTLVQQLCGGEAGGILTELPITRD